MMSLFDEEQNNPLLRAKGMMKREEQQKGK